MTVKRWLWGESSTILLLLAVSSAVLFAKLGAAELWTHEGRWAAICAHMIASGDYLHPYLFGEAYYDKPLLSYWLMIGVARLLGRLNETALRLPSALAGLLSLWCVYRLGMRRFDRATGAVTGSGGYDVRRAIADPALPAPPARLGSGCHCLRPLSSAAAGSRVRSGAGESPWIAA
jgi:hypothetical protein